MEVAGLADIVKLIFFIDGSFIIWISYFSISTNEKRYTKPNFIWEYVNVPNSSLCVVNHHQNWK